LPSSAAGPRTRGRHGGASCTPDDHPATDVSPPDLTTVAGGGGPSAGRHYFTARVAGVSSVTLAAWDLELGR
jgi:hypothetical protein